MNKILFCLFLLISIYSISQKAPIRVAIIGGGISGVSSAHHVFKMLPNAKITLFEKNENLGGNARTIKVKNRLAKDVFVDLGPQYFSEGPWDEYIAFIKEYHLYDEKAISSFSATAVINHQEKTNKPVFVSPKGGFRGEKMSRLMQFFKFYKAAHKVYLAKVDYKVTIGEWVATIGLKESAKTEIIYPFLAASLGTSISEIKKTDTKEIVKLFAFRGAMKKSEFKIFDRGMGNLIRDIGDSLERKGVQIHRGAEVFGVSGEKELTIHYQYKGSEKEAQFDFIIFATHPYQASAILRREDDYKKLAEILSQFQYFTAQIVLHRDSSFVENKKVSFLNIVTSETNEILSNTMNLGLINADLKGIYKSWLKSEDLQKIKDAGKHIHTEVFSHPLITPEFKFLLEVLARKVKEFPNIYFAGGWTEGLETQETAVISGKKAAEKLVKYLNLTTD